MNLSAKLKSFSAREIIYILYNGDNLFGHLIYNPTEEEQEFYRISNWDIKKHQFWISKMYTDFKLVVKYNGSETYNNFFIVIQNLNSSKVLTHSNGNHKFVDGWFFSISLNNLNIHQNESVYFTLIQKIIQTGTNRTINVDFK